MDVFEYGVAIITYDREEYKIRKDTVQLIYEFRTNTIDGEKTTPNNTSEKIEGAVVKVIDWTVWRRDYDPHTRPVWYSGDIPVYPDSETIFRITANELTSYMTPYLAKLGSQGWEVVEYKFSTEELFAQALLKRKVQK